MGAASCGDGPFQTFHSVFRSGRFVFSRNGRDVMRSLVLLLGLCALATARTAQEKEEMLKAIRMKTSSQLKASRALPPRSDHTS